MYVILNKLHPSRYQLHNMSNHNLFSDGNNNKMPFALENKGFNYSTVEIDWLAAFSAMYYM